MSESPILPSKYDGAVIKQTLDDVVVEVLHETYKENTSAVMLTSVLGVMSVGVACFGQFFINFPAQKQLLTLLIAVNIVITIVIQVISHVSGAGNLFKSKPSKFRPNEIVVATHMDRFSPTYSVVISSVKDASVKAELKKEVNEWIRSDGRVEKEALEAELRKTIQTVETALSNKKM